MAYQVVGETALELADVILVALAAVVVVHVGANGEYIANPSLTDTLNDQVEGRVAAEHVAHLEGEVLGAAAVQQLLEGWKAFARWLVHVDGQSLLHHGHGGLHQLVVRCLDADRLKPRIG